MAKLLSPSLMQGADMMDAISALIGFGVAGYIPSLIIKTPTAPATLSSAQKVAKVAIAFGGALLAGMALKKTGTGSAKAAVIGGMAGAAYQAINAFTSFQLVRGASAGYISSRPISSRIGDAQSAPFSSEKFGVIQP